MKLSLPQSSSNAPAGSSAGLAAGALIDPGSLMRIKNLELRAKVVVEGFLTGLHRSPYHGFSVEFSEYRQYSPGDDPRYLDWRLYARSDRYYIKRFEDETNLRAWLLVDLSRSMGYGAGDYTKADYAKTAAATLAYFLSLQRDAVGLLTFDQSITEFLPARFRPGHLHRLMLGLDRAPGGRSTDLAQPLERVAAAVAKRGLIVLISDLLAPVEALQKHLGYLRSRGHEVVLLRVLDPTELEFTFRDAAMFQDVESGRQLYVDPEAVRADYLRRFGEHAAGIRQACSNLGIPFHQIATDRPLELMLFDFLSARMRLGRTAAGRRAANPAAGGSR
jgi:uncharacterized protein (DUF58 family)